MVAQVGDFSDEISTDLLRYLRELERRVGELERRLPQAEQASER
jgi:hypothetical protein